ncbi:MAG TPA: IclR family transcriptional regulator [Acidimicrobiales bacterium]|nr:IclR family transcriptional regulator [Acidimicrobiales bacterium]
MERSIQLLDRAIAVLTACEAGPVPLQELAARAGLPRATAHRLAVALEGHGLLRRDDGRFALGPALARLGAVAASGPSLVVVARPALEELRDVTGESVQLYVRRGDERLCLLSLESPHSLRTIVPVGAVLPLDRGSAGRVLRDDEGGAPGDGRARADGWVQSVEEREPGVASVSAAVRDHRPGAFGVVVAAVSVSGPVERTTRSPGRRYGAQVTAAARAVERAAGLATGPR